MQYEDAIDPGNPYRHEVFFPVTDQASPVFQNLRLDSPITAQKVSHILCEEFQYQHEKEMKMESEKISTKFSVLYQRLGVDLWENCHRFSGLEEDFDVLRHCASVALSNAKRQFETSDIMVGDVLIPSLVKNIVKFFDKRGYFRMMTLLNNMVIVAGLLKSHKPVHEFGKRLKGFSSSENYISFTPTSKIKIWISNTYAIMYSPVSHVNYLLSLEMIQALADYFTQRTNIYLSSLIAMGYNHKHYLTIEQADFLFDWGDCHIKSDPMKAYDAIKTLEGLTTAILHRYSNDHICDTMNFYKFIEGELLSASQNISEECLTRSKGLILALRQWRSDLHIISQTFGLFRSWMHPIINELTGAIKLQETAMADKIVDLETLKKIERHFKMSYIVFYYKKHKIWPRLKFSERLIKCSSLYQRYKRNFQPIFSRKFCKMSDLDEIEGDKTYTINPTFDMSTVISDKTLCMSRSEVLRNIRENGNPGFGADRKVIIQWLKSHFIDPITLLEDVADNGLGYEDQIILLRGKERELKTDARLFCMMTLKARLYFVLTEDLLATHILPYFPQITMKDDQTTLLRKIFANTKLQRSSTAEMLSQFVICNIDFNKWNANFRHLVTYGIFTFIDQLLGYPQGLINKTHPFFTSCFVSLSSSYLPTIDPSVPEFIPSPWTWTHHLGGFEGIRQKGWTLFTVAMLHMICRELDLSFQIMGQGDNQVLRFHFPELTGLNLNTGREQILKVRRKLEEFQVQLPRVCARLGLPIKKEETWLSSTVFAYGKFLVVNGVPMIMATKKLLRMSPYANESYPSLETSVSSIFANGMQSSASDVSCHVPFSMTLLHAALAFYRNMEYSLICNRGLSPSQGLKTEFSIPDKDGHTRSYDVQSPSGELTLYSPSLLDTLLLVPRCLGGYPIMHVTSFMSRDFPDPLTESLAFLKKYLRDHPNPSSKYVLNSLLPKLSPHINPDLLISDVTSVNLILPTTPGNYLKARMRSEIKRLHWIKNPQISQMLSIEKSKEVTLLKEELMKCNPLHPRYLNALCAIIPEEYASSTLNKVQNTKTLVYLISMKKGEGILKGASKREIDYFVSFLWRIQTPEKSYEPVLEGCSARYAQFLREEGWKNPNIQGVTVPHPIEAFCMSYGANKICESCQCSDYRRNYISYKVAKRPRAHDYCCKLGPFQPYMGSKTVSKVYLPLENKLEGTMALFKKILTVASAIGWFIPRDDPLGVISMNIINCVSELPAELMIPKVQSISGSSAHRFQDSSTEHGGHINNLYTSASYITMSTDTMWDYKKSSQNTNLHYQNAMLMGQAIMSHRLQRGDIAISMGHYHQSHDCISILDESPMKGTTSMSDIKVPSFKDNKFLYVPQTVLLSSRTRDNLKEFDINEVDVRDIGDMYFALWIANNLVRHLEEEDTHYSLDVSFVNMIYYIRCNPVAVLTYVCEVVLGFIFWNKFYSRGIFPVKDDLISYAQSYLESLDLQDFAALSRLISYEECRRVLVDSLDYFVPVEVHPAPQYTMALCIKRLLIDHLDKSPDIWLLGKKFFLNQDIMDKYPWNYLAIFRGFKLNRLNLNTDSLGILENWINAALHGEESFIGCDLVQQIRLLKLEKKGPSIRYLEGLNDLYMGWNDVSMDVCCKTPKRSSDRSHRPKRRLMKKPLTACSSLGTLSTDLYISTPYEIMVHEITTNLSPQIQDIYELEQYRLFKWQTAGAPKISTLYSKIEEPLGDTKTLLVLGDGEGGISSFLIMMNKDLKVSSHTHYDVSTINRGSYTIMIPTVIEGFNLGKNLVNHPLTLEMETDVTQPESFISHLAMLGPQDALVSDIEGKFWNDPRSIFLYICSLSGCISVLKPGWVLIKFYHNFEKCTRVLLTVLGFSYKTVEVLRSHLTKRGSGEIYLLATIPTGRYEQVLYSHDRRIFSLLAEDLQKSTRLVNATTDYIMKHEIQQICNEQETEVINKYFFNPVDLTVADRCWSMIGIPLDNITRGYEINEVLIRERMKFLIRSDPNMRTSKFRRGITHNTKWKLSVMVLYLSYIKRREGLKQNKNLSLGYRIFNHNEILDCELTVHDSREGHISDEESLVSGEILIPQILKKLRKQYLRYIKINERKYLNTLVDLEDD